MDNEDVIVNAVIDDLRPDLLYPYIPMDGVEIMSNGKVSLNRTTLFSQYEFDDTAYACTVYGTAHAKHDTENKVTLDPRFLRLNEALKRGARKDYGWSMSGVLSMFLNLGLTKGHTVCRSLDEVKLALDNKETLVSGTRNCDFGATRRNKSTFVYTKNGPGHIFEICGYDDNRVASGMTGFLEVKNSSFNSPTIWIGYEQFQYIYTCVALIVDKEQMQIIKETVQEKTLKKAISLRITNGELLDEYMTRGQLAVMIGRVLYGVGDTSKNYMDKTRDAGIRNGNGEGDKVLRSDALVMLGRAMVGEKIKDGQAVSILITRGITDGSRMNDFATRFEGILLVTRLWAIRNDFILA